VVGGREGEREKERGCEGEREKSDFELKFGTGKNLEDHFLCLRLAVAVVVVVGVIVD